MHQTSDWRGNKNVETTKGGAGRNSGEDPGRDKKKGKRKPIRKISDLEETKAGTENVLDILSW